MVDDFNEQDVITKRLQRMKGITQVSNSHLWRTMKFKKKIISEVIIKILLDVSQFTSEKQKRIRRNTDEEKRFYLGLPYFI